MKKYHIGGSKGLIIFFIIISFISIPSVTIPIAMVFEFAEIEGFIALAIIPFILAYIGLFIFFDIFVIKQYSRKQKALQGHRTTGVVTNSYVYKGSGKVEIQYKTERGEDALLRTSVTPNRLRYFQIGNEIPLYVNGEYAYFKDEEIYENTDVFDRKVEDTHSESNYHHEEKSNNKFTFCPYCGASLEKNIDRCPHCRSRLM